MEKNTPLNSEMSMWQASGLGLQFEVVFCLGFGIII
jgi:hypothetical protein